MKKTILFLVLLVLQTQLYSSCSNTAYRPPAPSRKIAQVYDHNKIELPRGIEQLLSSEQILIDRSVDERIILAPTVEGQATEYRPENRNWFTLRTIWVPQDKLQIAELENSEFNNSNFIKTINDQKYYRLLIHPESVDFYSDLINKYEEGEKLLATSTSSSRTVLATDSKGYFFFAKLSLDVELGGVVRTIPKGEVARSIGYTMLTDELESPNKNFHIIRESLGINPNGYDRGGQILREIPKSAFKNESTIVPLFSLYSRGNGTETILKKMLQDENDPVNYVKDKILSPFAKAWVDWAVDAEIVMEAHAQNVLIQLDKLGKPTGNFYQRDLGGFNAKITDSNIEKKLPVFSTFKNDYHQKFHSDAIIQSLRVYFEGGFLFNVNSELKRLNISEVDMRLVFRDLIIEELQIKSGRKFKDLDNSNLYHNLIETLNFIKYQNGKISPLRNCINIIKNFLKG